MEATGEENMVLLHKIRPPNLEEAGLEDCALPPDSIHLAFLRAASTVGSRASSLLSYDNGCVTDPFPDKPSDALLGVQPQVGPSHGPCAKEKGGPLVDGGGGMGDLVGERNEEDVKKADDVVVVGEGDGGCGGCVEGIKDLKVKERDNHVVDDEDEDEDESEKQPSLVEGYCFINP